MKKGILFLGAICIAIASFAILTSFEDANQAKIDAKYDELKKAFLETKMTDCLASADAVAKAKYDEEVAKLASGAKAEPGKTKPGTRATTNTTNNSTTNTTTTTTTKPNDKTSKIGGDTKTTTNDKTNKMDGKTTDDKSNKMKGGK